MDESHLFLVTISGLNVSAFGKQTFDYLLMTFLGSQMKSSVSIVYQIMIVNIEQTIDKSALFLVTIFDVNVSAFGKQKVYHILFIFLGSQMKSSVPIDYQIMIEKEHMVENIEQMIENMEQMIEKSSLYLVTILGINFGALGKQTLDYVLMIFLGSIMKSSLLLVYKIRSEKIE